jgi:hypothetical protein
MSERIVVTEGGWCRLVLDEPDVQVKLRFAETPTGRLAAAEVVLARWPGVSTDSLRAVPLGRVEAWANGPGRQELLSSIARLGSMSDAREAALHARERAEANLRATWGRGPEAVAAEEATLRDVDRLGVREQFDAGLVAIGPDSEGKLIPLRSRVRSARLRVPEGQPKPDSFYREVARVYGEVSLSSPRPARVIAEANDVLPSTVHGWVKEARRREFLAPGERQGRKR